MTLIDPSLVSVVVQGPRTPVTEQTLSGIRLHLPGARIVMSTWDGTDIDGLDIDDLVVCPDPGAMDCAAMPGLPGPPINANRMIRSTFAGLGAVDRPFVVKVRTDAIVEHAGVLTWIAALPPAVGEWAIFSHVVGVSSVFTRNPLKTPLGSYHPADTVQFGQTSDLLQLWDVPMMPDSDANFFPDPSARPTWSGTSQRYYPEQWVFLCALRRHHTVDFEHNGAFTAATISASNRALAQNFLVAEPWQMGIRVPHLDRQLRFAEDPVCVMTHPIWHQLREAALVPTT